MKLNTLFAAAGLLLAASPVALAQTNAPAAAPAATSQPQWYSHQAGEMRASKLIGTSVVNAGNETVGEVNDVILGRDGKVAAVVIGVGGFLGMGERNVALAFSSLQMNRDANDNLRIVMNSTKDTLKSAPEWRWETVNK